MRDIKQSTDDALRHHLIVFIKKGGSMCWKYTSIYLCVMGILATPSFATSLKDAIDYVKNSCSGISESMHDLKVKAGISTAVTAGGAVASGFALGAGIAKKQTDDFLDEETQKILEKYANNPQDKIIIENKTEFEQALDQMVKEAEGASGGIQETDVIKETMDKSDKLGKIRTGTLAASAVANITGTALAATNTISEDLEAKIKQCIQATEDLTRARLQAQVENTATTSELGLGTKIIDVCRDYATVDLSPINNRAKGGAIFAGVAAGTGIVGTITSSLEASRGNQTKTDNLDTASNVLAGGTAAAGLVSTVFNATQISAIKKVVAIADKCEEALK